MTKRSAVVSCVAWTCARVALLAAGAALVACVVERDEREPLDPGVGVSETGGSTASGDDGSGSTGSTTSTTPADAGVVTTTTGTGPKSLDGGASLTAVVDTNRSLNAVAGQGVGVFVEYDSGGHWDITWTCDTALSNQTCDFALLFTVVGGGVGGAVPTNVQVYGDPVVPPVEGGLAVTSTTGSTIDGVTFDTAPGATIEMTTKLSGEPNSSIVFFVQDGAVNGGFTGTLPNPLGFVGSSP